jgi:hypothetical protein
MQARSEDQSVFLVPNPQGGSGDEPLSEWRVIRPELRDKSGLWKVGHFDAVDTLGDR